MSDKQGEGFIVMRRRAFLFMSFLLLPVGTLLADSIPPDPTLIVIRGGKSTVITTFPFTGTLDIPCTAEELSFVPASLGFIPQGCFAGNNETGHDITTFELTIPVTAADEEAALTCASAFDVFHINNCGTLPDVESGTVFFTLTFTGGDIPPIRAGQNISHFLILIDLWQVPPSTIDLTVPSAVPEPGTMALLLTGIGALVGRRRLSRGARSDG